MQRDMLLNSVQTHLETLCNDIADRSVGSDGNRHATIYFQDVLQSFGWPTESQAFQAMDWHDGGATLTVDQREFQVRVSPYSPGCSATAELISASNLSELENGDFQGKILLLHGELAKEQLMPKNFVFYNPEEHQQIVALLERSQVKAIIAATGRNAALAGGVYPFPLIEDGDFDIPSVYMTEEEGQRLLPCVGETTTLHSVSRRIPGDGYNIIGKRGGNQAGRIVVTAHIDAKKGTPGATDNATGVTVLLLLAQLLQEYSESMTIELVAFNGEDYYAVPGQMQYIKANQNNFDDILLNINIDGAGYIEGKSTFSFFDLPVSLKKKMMHIIHKYPETKEGGQWPQGDHSIFLQYGRPALAVSSEWFTEHGESQDITHTPKDNLSIVDYDKIVVIARALDEIIRELVM